MSKPRVLRPAIVGRPAQEDYANERPIAFIQMLYLTAIDVLKGEIMTIFNNCYHADDQKRHRWRLESRSKSKISYIYIYIYIYPVGRLAYTFFPSHTGLRYFFLLGKERVKREETLNISRICSAARIAFQNLVLCEIYSLPERCDTGTCGAGTGLATQLRRRPFSEENIHRLVICRYIWVVSFYEVIVYTQ